MKNKLIEIQDAISKSGELLNNNIGNDYGFSYGEISEVLHKAENKILASDNKSQAKTIAFKKNIHKFYDEILLMIEHEIDKKNIIFSEQDCKRINEYLYEAYNQMGDIIKQSDEYKKINIDEE